MNFKVVRQVVDDNFIKRKNSHIRRNRYLVENFLKCKWNAFSICNVLCFGEYNAWNDEIRCIILKYTTCLDTQPPIIGQVPNESMGVNYVAHQISSGILRRAASKSCS